MELILLKSNACLLAFIAFYKVFLERTSNHQFKRFYLLLVVLISIGIPFITFVEYIEPQFILGEFSAFPLLNETPAALEETKNYVPIVLWSIYGLGVLLFSLRFSYNLIHIFLKIKRNPKKKNPNFISVLLQDLVVPHTFFSYIFLNKTKFENKEIPSEVLLHEETHAKQKHSLDILFIELLQIVFWFNPLVYILKRDIKLNHEFLADQAVINQGIEPSNYQNLLLEFSSTTNSNHLANAINYSLIKKRFTIMKTETSKQSLWLRSALLLPLLAILTYGFSTTKQVEKEIVPKMEFNGKTLENRTPILKLNQNPLELILDGKQTSFENLKEDFKQATNNKKSDLRINSDGNHIDIEIIEKILNRLEDNLSKIILSDGITINDTRVLTKVSKSKAIVTQKTLPTINGIACDYCELRLPRESIKKLVLGTTNNQKVKSFKIKFPGHPTQTIEGNKGLNKDALVYLAKAPLGQIIQIFDIKVPNEKFGPILIALVSKSDKNYSHSPKVVKGKLSNVPLPNAPKVVKGELTNIPPPPPPVPADATPEQKAKYKKAIEGYYKRYEIKDGNVSRKLLPPPPPPKNASKDEKLNYEKEQLKYLKEHQARLKEKELALKEMEQRRRAEKKSQMKMRESQMVEREKERELALKERNLRIKQREAQMVEREKERELALKERQLMLEKRRAELPPPPPPPKSPLEHVINMAKKGATFYYNGKKVTSDEAIALLKNNENLNISSNTNDGVSTVKLSTKGIKVKH